MKDVKVRNQCDLGSSEAKAAAVVQPNPLWLTNEVMTGTPQRIIHLLNHWDFRGIKLPCNYQDDFERAPLHYAAVLGKTEVVKLLLALPEINVNILDKFRMSPLNMATFQNHSEVVKELLKHSEIDVNQVNMFHQTPLCLAAKLGNEEIVKALLAHPKTDITIPDMHAVIPATYANLNNHDKIAELINKRITLGASIERVLKFIDAVKCGDLPSVVYELQRDPSIAVIHAPNGYNAMDHAVALGYHHIVDALKRHPWHNRNGPASDSGSWEDVSSSDGNTMTTERPSKKKKVFAYDKSAQRTFLGSSSSGGEIDH